MKVTLNKRKSGIHNLRKKYSGFKILRGYENNEIYPYKLIVLFIIKSREPRKGTLTRFCLDRIKENKSVVISQPTTPEMFAFLEKNNFVRLTKDEWILTPFMVM